MDKHLKKALEGQLKAIQAHMDTLFEHGHTFWYCDAQDEEHSKPFYYFQINKTQSMATCGTCQTLMDLRRELRVVQKALGLPMMPFTTNEKSESHVKRMHVSNNSMFNPNYSYL